MLKKWKEMVTAKLLFDQQEYLGCVYSRSTLMFFLSPAASLLFYGCRRPSAEGDCLPDHQWEYVNSHGAYDWLTDWSGKFPAGGLVACAIPPSVGVMCVTGLLLPRLLQFARRWRITRPVNKNNNNNRVVAVEGELNAPSRHQSDICQEEMRQNSLPVGWSLNDMLLTTTASSCTT